MSLIALLAGLLILVLALAGCGGDDETTGGGGRTSLRATVRWPSLEVIPANRAIEPPRAANAVVVRLDGAALNGTDVEWLLSRPNTDERRWLDYVSSFDVITGTYPGSVSFYTGFDGRGTLLAEAVFTATILGDGSGLPPVTADTSGLESITVDPDQELLVGERRALRFIALAGNSVLALAPGVLGWQVSAGTDRLEPITSGSDAGLLRGLAAGEATVAATLGGFVSDLITVNVVEGADVGDTGGAINGASGAVRLTVPPRALTGSQRITARPALNSPADARLVPDTDFDLRPNTLNLRESATLTLRYDPTTLPTGADEANLVVGELRGGQWVPLAGSTVDTVGKRVAVSINRLGTFGLLALPPA